MKNYGAARVLAVIFPGLGHIFLGNWIKGIIFILLWIWAIVVMIKNIALYSFATDNVFLRIFLPATIIWIFNLISIHNTIKDSVKKNNHSESL